MFVISVDRYMYSHLTDKTQIHFNSTKKYYAMFVFNSDNNNSPAQIADLKRDD